MKKKNRLAKALVFASLAFETVSPAFGIQGDIGTNMAALRQELRGSNPAKIMRFEGSLSCDLGTQNSGEGCALKLLESSTGKLYRLLEARSAQRLFLDGSKNVIIEGRLADLETIEVKTARTLERTL